MGTYLFLDCSRMATSRVRWTEEESLLLVRLYLEHGVTQGVKGGLLDGLVATFNKELGYGTQHVRRRDSKSIQNRISRLRAGRRTRKKRGEHAYAHLRTREAREFYMQKDTYLDQIERSKSNSGSSSSVGGGAVGVAGSSSGMTDHLANSGFLARPTHVTGLSQSTKDRNFAKKRKRDFDPSSMGSLHNVGPEFGSHPLPLQHWNAHNPAAMSSSASSNMAWMQHAQLMAQMQYQQAFLASSNPALIAYAAQMANMGGAQQRHPQMMPQPMQVQHHQQQQPQQAQLPQQLQQQYQQSLAHQTPAPVHPNAALGSATPALASSLSLLEIPSSSRERSLSPQSRPQAKQASPLSLPQEPSSVDPRPSKKHKPLTPVSSDIPGAPSSSSDLKGSRSSSLSPSHEEASAADVLLALS